jgi:type I restriction enzyme, S subunit
MADEWKIVGLSELYEFSSGLSKPRSEFGFGQGFLTFKDVLDNYFVPSELSALVNSTEKERANCSISRGDVFLTRTSETQHELGMSCVALKDYPEATFNGFTKRLRPKSSIEIVPEYAAYFFRSPRFRRDVTSMSTLSTRASLNNEMLSRLSIVLPPIDQQKAIGIVLKALDDKIELNRRRNRTLEAMARAIFQSWFVDFDPVKAKAAGRTPPGLKPEIAALFPDSFEGSPLGPIPKGWQIKTLGELTAKIGSGATPRGGEKVYVDDGIALVRSQNVYDFEFRWEGLARITAEAASALDGVALDKEDILFNITGASILRTCVVDPAVLPARVNQHVARIRAKPEIPPRFLHLSLVRDEMKQHLIGFNAGATREAVTKGHLQSIRLVVPPNPLLQQFAKAARPLYSQKDMGLRQLSTLASLRDTLLPKLISGELRVPDAERIVWRAL